jgi:S1-C subfamily serine protease
MRPLVLIFLATTVVFGQAPKPVPKKPIRTDVSEAIEQIRPSVVQIEVELAYKYKKADAPAFDKVLPAGSGFVADTKGHIVTALHVVKDIDSLRDKVLAQPVTPLGPIDPDSIKTRILIGFQLHNSFGPRLFVIGSFLQLEGTVSKRSTTADAALLQVSPEQLAAAVSQPAASTREKNTAFKVLKPVPAKFDDHFAKEGEMIAVSGFPLALPSMVTNVGWIGSQYILLDTDMSDGPRFGQLGSVQINLGNSGGPVYRVRDGAVIGIAVAYKNAPVDTVQVQIGNTILSGRADINSGLCIIVPIKEALALLTQ